MSGHQYITGIQQVGIGVKNVRESMLFYKALFGMDVLIFDDTSAASLMTKYTGDNVHKRRAVLSMNLAGGGGFEIWQFTDREAQMPAKEPCYSDLGIYAAKIKCRNILAAFNSFSKFDGISIYPIQQDPAGNEHFWLQDSLGNYFHIIEGTDWFKKDIKITGGVAGAVIGVADMEKAIVFYRRFLGINNIIYDKTDTFDDNPLAERHRYRRVLLKKDSVGNGAFCNLLGSVEIELVQCLDRTPNVIFENRFWGDCGFIHCCFDVTDMTRLKNHAASLGIHFTVDSNESFAMENASGRFCYAEDPDGTLIEMVETHKIPIIQKLGWFMDLQKRKNKKPLPDWMINLLALSKVK